MKLRLRSARLWVTTFVLFVFGCVGVLVGERVGWLLGVVVAWSWSTLFLVGRTVFHDAEGWNKQYRQRLAKGPMHAHADPGGGRPIPCYDADCTPEAYPWRWEEAS